MSVATARSIALHGTQGHLVDVQVDVSAGMVATTLVGRPDITLQEARERCRMAISNSGLAWPATRKVTILLSPADLIKRGSHFDLAVAVAVIGASDPKRPLAGLDSTLFIGELTLDGGLRSVPGVLPMVLAARASGLRRVFLPEPQVQEAALVPDMEVLGMRSLAQVIAELRGEPVPRAASVVPASGQRLLSWRGQDRLDDVDLADVHGLPDARFALEVAAAGGHHLMLTGPKGSGKTTLAERLPSILPDLDREEALELCAVHSIAGDLQPGSALPTRPPYAAPHHTASRASVLGGGSGRVRPGAISLAHCGVLLLDEFPLFASDVIEALREPMESGDITLSRGEETATYPARGLLVLACNPCWCGNRGCDPSLGACECTPQQLRDYDRRVSGPLVDRVDIQRVVEPARLHDLHDPLSVPEPSAEVARRVTTARERQAARFTGRGWRLNAHAPQAALHRDWPLPVAGSRLLAEAAYEGRLSARGSVRVHRLAMTVADLRGLERPGVEEVAVALRLRTGEPMPLQAIELAG